MYVSNTITFVSLDVECSFSVSGNVFREYGSSSYMKVIWSRWRSQRQKAGNLLVLQSKTSVGNNSG